ncbi:MAG: caspase family protein [Clostridia bacterium]|nr:caspase family protein [Clostridia bacterium]
MKQRRKTILALLLSLVMLLALIPSASAERAEEPANDPDRVPERTEVPEEDASDGKREPEICISQGLSLTEKNADAMPAVSEGTRRIDDSALRLGVNWFTVSEPGETVYRPFTIPISGYYWFSSLSPYYEDGIVHMDTVGYLTDSSLNVTFEDNDGGYDRFFSIRSSGYHDAGEVLYVGVRFYDETQTGSIPVLIDYPYASGSPELTLGENTYTISTQGSIWYYPFRPTESGTYRVYSVGEDDTLGVLLEDGYGAILYNDDSNESTNFSFTYEMNAGETYWIGARYYSNDRTGSIKVVIEKKEAAFEPEIVWNSSDVKFKGTTPYVIANGKAKKPRFTVRNKADGTTVDPSGYTYEYRENTAAGTGYVFVTFTGAHSGTIRGWFKIYLPATKTTTVVNRNDGIKITWDAVNGAAGYVIYRRAWSSKTGKWTTFERWNNTTELSWTDTNVYATSRYQYGVKAYFAKRTDPVTGTQIGGNVGDNYNLGMVGPLRTTVRVTTRVLKSLVAGNNQITVNWSPSNKFTGYQIKYATNASFTENVKSVWVSDPAQGSIDIPSLKNGTTYYVCLRSYQNFEGSQYYGAWSNVLSMKPGSGQTVTNSKYRALLVGESDYESEWENDLPGSGNDADAIAGMLSGLSNKFTCTKLHDATKTQILNGIKTTFAAANDYDVSLFYFAGHGAGGTGSLCTVEGGRITFSELAEALSKVKGRVIVVISSCYSGNAIATTDAAGESFDPEAYNQAIIDAFSGYYLEPEDGQSGTRSGELRKSKFVVFTAAAANEVGWEGCWDTGVNYDNGTWYRGHAIGSAILKGMGCKYPNGTRTGSSMPADKNGNREVTVKELYDYVSSTVYDWTKNVYSGGYSGPQNVQYYGPNSEVLFRKY